MHTSSSASFLSLVLLAHTATAATTFTCPTGPAGTILITGCFPTRSDSLDQNLQEVLEKTVMGLNLGLEIPQGGKAVVTGGTSGCFGIRDCGMEQTYGPSCLSVCRCLPNPGM